MIPPLTEKLAINALALRFEWYRQLVAPNIHLCGGEMDVAVLSPAGYLWEIEVKLSLSDWKADQKKRKWINYGGDRRHVNRFYYAVPKELLEKVPDFVPPEAGLIYFIWGGHEKRWHAYEHRPAKYKRGKEHKAPEKVRQKMLQRTYHAFWRSRARTY